MSQATVAQFRRDIADWIATYRAAERPPSAMREACLATFPAATGSDFAVGVMLANRSAAA